MQPYNQCQTCAVLKSIGLLEFLKSSELQCSTLIVCTNLDMGSIVPKSPTAILLLLQVTSFFFNHFDI